MTGIIAQLIALVSFGNEYLETGELIDGFYPENTTFQFCNSVIFVVFKKALFSSKPNESVIAGDPVKWLELLKKEGCKKLALNFKGSEDQSKAADHRLAGMAGGGGTWFIEAIYNKHSDLWINNWSVTHKDAADRRIWTVKYGILAWRQQIFNLQYDLGQTRDELESALQAIADFAYKNDLPGWGSTFEKATNTLKKSLPEDGFYHQDLIVTPNYSLPARQLLFSAGMAWVFGGMGSWNDLVFDDPEKEVLYDELSAQLYHVIIKSIISVCNS